MTEINWYAERTVTIQPGVYFLCDPCYVIEESEYLEILKQTRFLNDVYAESRRGVIAVFHTGDDGTFTDTEGNEYPVDSGLLGLIDTRYNPEEAAQRNYRQVVISVPTLCTSRSECQYLTFGDISICTINDDDRFCGDPD